MKARRVTRIFAFFLSFLLFLMPLSLAASAEDDGLPSMKEASSAYLYHVERMREVLSKEAARRTGAGSTVKVMAGLLLCEAMEERLSERILITAEMMESVPSPAGFSLRIRAGDEFTVEQLLYAAVCAGYNDAFYLLGAIAFGSVRELLDAMNRRASAMGLESTSYTDVTGIEPGSLTSAIDLCRVALEAYEMPLYMKLCGTEVYRLNDGGTERTLYNRNAMISTQGGLLSKYYNKHCYGMSAGTTSADGNCVVSIAEYDGQTYLAIVLGGRETATDEYGYHVANRLFDWVEGAFSYVEVLSPEKNVCTLPVELSDSVKEIAVRTKESYSAYLPKGSDPEKLITCSIRLTHDVLVAPVEEELFVGYVAVLYEGQLLATLPLYTAASAERNPFMGAMRDLQDFLTTRAVIAGLVCFVLSLILWISLEVIFHKRRHRKWDRYFSRKIQLPPNEIRSMEKRKK